MKSFWQPNKQARERKNSAAKFSGLAVLGMPIQDAPDSPYGAKLDGVIDLDSEHQGQIPRYSGIWSL
jgi:hypothetical protein